jgi:hypothetical protein
MKLFSGKEKAEKKWRKRAWMVDSEKTRIIFDTADSLRPKRVPPWIYGKRT